MKNMSALITREMLYAIIIILLSLNGLFVAQTYNEEDNSFTYNGDNYQQQQQQNETISYQQDRDMPKFGEQMQNLTIPVGREATLACVVDNLQTYKIAWLRVDTQTILTIQNHVITKNHRISIAHMENRAWVLKIKDVKESDRGYYMCQINTDPMKSQTVYINVVVPPDILDYSTSTDMVVREGYNVTLKCAASGSPEPIITWRRENGEPIPLSPEVAVTSYNRSVLTILRVNRLHMGAYLCIASNGVPPSVSKRVRLTIHFAPQTWIQNQLVGAAYGQVVTLECTSEAFPKSINYWMKNDTIITSGNGLEPSVFENEYKVLMKLSIAVNQESDFGNFKCVAKNSLGETDGSIKLYRLPQSTPVTTVSTTTVRELLTTTSVHYKGNDNFIGKDRTMHNKSHRNLSASSNNNLFHGATSGSRNADVAIDRDHRMRNDGIPSPEVDRDRGDLLSDNEISNGADVLHHLSRTQHCILNFIILNSIIYHYSLLGYR